MPCEDCDRRQRTLDRYEEALRQIGDECWGRAWVFPALGGEPEPVRCSERVDAEAPERDDWCAGCVVHATLERQDQPEAEKA